MEKVAEGNIGKFVDRRSSTVKVAVRLLNHELELAQGAQVTLDRSVLENVVSTLELFLEDFSESYTRQMSAAAAERRMVEPVKTASAPGRVN